VVDLAKSVKAFDKQCYIFVGGHSGSFIADDLLEHGNGAIDCVLRGEGEISTPLLLAAVSDGGIAQVAGVRQQRGARAGPATPRRSRRFPPARDLVRRRRHYFIGELDPCASIEFTRGCPWDCSFCSAWTSMAALTASRGGGSGCRSRLRRGTQPFYR